MTPKPTLSIQPVAPKAKIITITSNSKECFDVGLETVKLCDDFLMFEGLATSTEISVLSKAVRNEIRATMKDNPNLSLLKQQMETTLKHHNLQCHVKVIGSKANNSAE